MLRSLDPDQDRHSVGPDLGPNYLQRLSADDKVDISKERHKISLDISYEASAGIIPKNQVRNCTKIFNLKIDNRKGSEALTKVSFKKV